MANKFQIADYLSNLHNLLGAQDKAGLQKSQVLIDEYDRNWDILKDTITKESEDETRSSKR